MSDLPENYQAAVAQQRAFREQIARFLQGSSDEPDNIVIGFAMVIEVLDGDGERCLLKVTSDAGGNPLSLHTVRGMKYSLVEDDEFDQYLIDAAFDFEEGN